MAAAFQIVSSETLPKRDRSSSSSDAATTAIASVCGYYAYNKGTIFHRDAQIREQTKQAAARGDAAVTPLADLDFVPFLDKDGKLTQVDTKGVKASVYAVYDEVRGLEDDH